MSVFNGMNCDDGSDDDEDDDDHLYDSDDAGNHWEYETRKEALQDMDVCQRRLSVREDGDSVYDALSYAGAA